MAAVANACMPCSAELQYVQNKDDVASMGGSLLVLLNPRVPVASGAAISLVLPDFSLLPAIEKELKAKKEEEQEGQAAGRGERKGAEAGDKEGKEEAVLSKQAYTSLNKLHWRQDAAVGTWFEGEPKEDKAVSVEAELRESGLLLTITPQVDVGADDVWGLVMPDALQLALPWDGEEDEALAALVGEQDKAGGEGCVDWSKVATQMPGVRSAVEAENRWLRLKGLAQGAPDKPFECSAWLPLPAPDAALRELVWALQIIPDAGADGKAGSGDDDLVLKFAPGNDLMPGDVLALLLPGVSSGPTFLGESRLDHTGASWSVYSRLSNRPASPGPRGGGGGGGGGGGLRPLALHVPAGGKLPAVLLVELGAGIEKGNAVTTSIVQVSGVSGGLWHKVEV